MPLLLIFAIGMMLIEQNAFFSADDDLLWRHLKTLPAFRALLRAVEARFYQQLDIPEPVLDLGCGDGNFAGMAFDKSLSAGIDPWWGPLKKSRKAGIYDVPAQALGDAMPFPDGHFGSVISNSVLEHIPDIQPVLHEANRVLRPGGKLIITMPSHLFTENLRGAELLGDSYRDFFNFISRHAHTDSPEQWAGRLAQAGFRVVRWQYYFSKGALHALEWGHVQGLPSAVLHALTGHWIVAPWKENLQGTDRWVRPFYDEEPPEEGAYILFVAEKVADEPIQVALPPAQPFSQAELQEGAGEWADFGGAEPIMPAEEPELEAWVPVGVGLDDGVLLDGGLEVVAEREEELTASKPRFNLVAICLGALTALLAVFAQSVFSSSPDDPAGGLRLYGYSFITLLGLVYYVRNGLPDWRLPRPGQIPRHRYLYIPAFILAVFAQSHGSATTPLIPLLLWLLAITLAYYALSEKQRLEIGDWGSGSGDQSPATSDQPPIDTPHPTSHTPHPTRYLIPLALFLLALLPRLIALADHPFILNGVETTLGLDAIAAIEGRITNPFSTGWLTNPTLPTFLLSIPLRLLGRTAFSLRVLSTLVGALTVLATYLFGSRIWNQKVGLIAAIFLLGSHLHLHYSRLGMNNIWDPLMILLPLGFITLAYQRANSRQLWLLAGLTTGLSGYFFTSSHLLPIMLAGLLLYLLLFDREAFRKQGRMMLVGLALALIVLLPQYLYYRANPTIFMERANGLGIFQNEWLAQETRKVGKSSLDLLTEQFWNSALAFNYSLDTTTTYNPGIPFLRFWPSILFVFGLGVAAWRARQLRYAVLLIWFWVSVVFAGALLVGAPDSHRLIVALPAVCFMIAIALSELTDKVRLPEAARWEAVRQYAVPIVAVLAVLLVAGDVFFYFGRYQEEHRFGDRNTEIADGIGDYLAGLDGEWTGYLYGPPSVFIDFPNIPFLAEEFRGTVNWFNVLEPGDPLTPSLYPESDIVFVFLPERFQELQAVQAEYPGGVSREFEGVFSNPLFYAYEVSR